MALRDDIIAVVQDGKLNRDERRKRIAQMKAIALVLAVRRALPLTITPREDISILVESVRLDQGNVSATLTVLKDGAPVPFSNPLIVSNPPILVADPEGDVELRYRFADGVETPLRFREDLVEAFRQIVGDTVLIVVGDG